MRVLITGASGFVGKNLIKYLNSIDGFHAVGLSLREEGWINFNIDSFDSIIHLAGKAHDTSNVSHPSSYFEINRDLTITLFNKFKHSSVKDFLFFSSVKAVADTVDNILFEDAVPYAITPYGVSKLQAEMFLNSQELPDNKRVFILRPCMIHGPGNKGNLNLLYKIVEKGIPWPLASFENERSFLSIENLSFLISRILINNDLKSATYNLADDDFISTNQLVEIISEVLERKSKLLKINPRIIKFIANFGDKFPFPLNSERLKKLTESYKVSNTKIKTDLSLLKLPITAIDGLKRTIKSFK
ncbi:NAD-dependent epimerase/dehydratase family protein [Sphingobacterium hotanense]|uniref:NAD-dependent epimerase/dehydratase family protein n=1 Tax=Sphingobacterium hotanense TaxID=649196 RepID=UPI0021A7D66F|nr:NAD-dependent epimerase/dehydratase family protein [Sphingobacterium hotanense]MCT1523540.1 NAD-dependent epimerase/dehydratase family protein [Sphingobacterium hotanense]